MADLEASCPGCGGPIAFNVPGSVVKVCEFCGSVVARADRELSEIGKVAELAETRSPLAVGVRGQHMGDRFEIVGRAQHDHPAGGVWDEWFLSFPRDRWGWLSEAQGRFYLTRRKQVAAGKLPSFDSLQPGTELKLPGVGKMVVTEAGEGVTRSAQGEIPYDLEPGETFRFADLEGHHGRFATIDFGSASEVVDDEGEAPVLYVGKELTLDELGVEGTERKIQARKIEAHQLSCVQCGGGLELRAPDMSERVTCPYCGALHDIKDSGDLEFLELLDLKVKPRIPLGAKGTLDGVEFQVIGFLRRSVKEDGIDYYWSEYLLYEPRAGFRWLAHAQKHWTLFTPTPAPEAKELLRKKKGGKRFRLFQQGKATVRNIQGECYWKVSVGDEASTSDFIRPPQMLSKELQATDKNRELSWVLGEYVTPEVIAETFDVPVKQLGRPVGVAPNQPYPMEVRPIYRMWGMMALMGLAIFILLWLKAPSSERGRIFEKTWSLQSDGATQPMIHFSDDPIEIRSLLNLRMTGNAGVDNSWLYVAIDLINEESNVVHSFDLPIEYYHGRSGGESWSEGSRTKNRYVSALPQGEYTVRIEATWGPSATPPPTLRVRIQQGVPRVGHFVLALLVLSILPIIVFFKRHSFEVKRWKDSAHSPYAQSS